jgi:hypothetical protein
MDIGYCVCLSPKLLIVAQAGEVPLVDDAGALGVGGMGRQHGRHRLGCKVHKAVAAVVRQEHLVEWFGEDY